MDQRGSKIVRIRKLWKLATQLECRLGVRLVVDQDRDVLDLLPSLAAISWPWNRPSAVSSKAKVVSLDGALLTNFAALRLRIGW